MEEPSSPSNAYQAEQYQLAAGEDTQFQKKFLTEEEERELATTSNRQERRRIQNRVAQRAYRQKQKRRLLELEERLTSGDVGYTPPPEVDEALRQSRGLDAPNTWSSLATSYPIAATLTTHMSRSSQPPTTIRSSLSTLASARESDRYLPSGDEIDRLGHSLRTTLGDQQSQPIYAVGYIQPAAADIPDDATPFLTISILPVRIAILMNLEIMGIGLQQYRSDNATSPFLTGQFSATGSQPLSLEHVITAMATSAPCLVPTRLQLEVEHHPYVDIIPSSAIRNRILEAVLNETLDEEELCQDIERGLRVWGKTPWDERCWEWSVAFVDKWEWLFDRETLQVTNFWRVHRGEAAIDIVGGSVSGGETGDPASDRFGKGKKPDYSVFRWAG